MIIYSTLSLRLFYRYSSKEQVHTEQLKPLEQLDCVSVCVLTTDPQRPRTISTCNDVTSSVRGIFLADLAPLTSEIRLKEWVCVRSLLSELARVCLTVHRWQEEGAFRAMRDLRIEEREPRATGPRLGPPGPAPGYLWGQSARSRWARGRAEAAALGPARLERVGGRPGAPCVWKSTPHPCAPARPRSGENGAPGTTVTQ